jgi:23S rRNA pseudouridine955/2504/2580 synthase
MQQNIFEITAQNHGKRLDKFLYEQLKIPFSLAQKLIRIKDIKVNNAKTTSSYCLSLNDKVLVKNFALQIKSFREGPNIKLKQDLLNNIEVIFKDENILAINKPYDIAVQGGNKIKISIDDILDDLKFGYEERPKLVHRLDRHTSGLLLIARTKKIAQELMKLFQEKQIHKTYLALLVSQPKKKAGTLIMNIKKNTVGDIEKMTEADDGKEAITNYKVLECYSNNTCLVEFTPITGKMHQIRIHAAEILKCPIVGDKKYGGNEAISTNLINKNKLHLTAIKISIENLNGKKYNIDCQLPIHIKQSLSTKYSQHKEQKQDLDI